MTLKDILWTLVTKTRVHIRLKGLCETEEFHGEVWWFCVLFGEEYPEYLDYTVKVIRINADNSVLIVAYKEE